MCLNIGTPKTHHFPFGTNGKVVVLGVRHFRIIDSLSISTGLKRKVTMVVQLIGILGQTIVTGLSCSRYRWLVGQLSGWLD